MDRHHSLSLVALRPPPASLQDKSDLAPHPTWGPRGDLDSASATYFASLMRKVSKTGNSAELPGGQREVSFPLSS